MRTGFDRAFGMVLLGALVAWATACDEQPVQTPNVEVRPEQAAGGDGARVPPAKAHLEPAAAPVPKPEDDPLECALKIAEGAGDHHRRAGLPAVAAALARTGRQARLLQLLEETESKLLRSDMLAFSAAGLAAGGKNQQAIESFKNTPAVQRPRVMSLSIEECLRLAIVAAQQDDHQVLERTLAAIRDLVEAAGDDLDPHIHLRLAEWTFDNGKAIDAIASVETILRTARAQKKGGGGVLIQLEGKSAALLARAGAAEWAIKIAEAMDPAERKGEMEITHNRRWTRVQIADQLVKNGDLEGALKLAGGFGPPEDADRVGIETRVASAYAGKGDTEKALALVGAIKTKAGVQVPALEVSEALARGGDHKSAWKMASGIRPLPVRCHALLRLVRFYHETSDVERVKKAWRAAYKFSNKIRKKQVHLLVLADLASTGILIGEDQKAEEFVGQLISGGEKVATREVSVRALLDLVDKLALSKPPDRAAVLLSTVEKGLARIDPAHTGKLVVHILDSWYQLGRHERAVDLLDRWVPKLMQNEEDSYLRSDLGFQAVRRKDCRRGIPLLMASGAPNLERDKFVVPVRQCLASGQLEPILAMIRVSPLRNQMVGLSELGIWMHEHGRQVDDQIRGALKALLTK